MFSPNPGDEKGRRMRRKTLVAGIFENKEFESETRGEWRRGAPAHRRGLLLH